jgi:hypothetical protein
VMEVQVKMACEIRLMLNHRMFGTAGATHATFATFERVAAGAELRAVQGQRSGGSAVHAGP